MRVKKSFTRKTGLRDARLIIIATEGEKTEKTYFMGVATKFKTSKVHVEVLDRLGSGSDPETCLEVLNKFKRRYNLNKNDELWLVCDVDRWGAKKLSRVSQLCKQKGYYLSVSNPCFELWLLIHFVTLSTLDDVERNKLCSTCVSIEERLRTELGSYNKSNLIFEVYSDKIAFAMLEGKKLDNPLEAWPNMSGSKIINLMDSILRS